MGGKMRLRASHSMCIALLASFCGSDLPAASRKVPALPPDRQPCANVHLPGADQFHREWMRLGGPGGPMGCPTQIKVHPDGGGTITLQNGEISVSHNVWGRGVVAAYQDWDNILVDWRFSWDEPLPPSHFHYDEFLVRGDYNGQHFDGDQWDVRAERQGNKIIQFNYEEDTHLRTKGTSIVPAKHGDGRYSFSVEGCDLNGPLRGT